MIIFPSFPPDTNIFEPNVVANDKISELGWAFYYFTILSISQTYKYPSFPAEIMVSLTNMSVIKVTFKI